MNTEQNEEQFSNIASKNNITIKAKKNRFHLIEAPEDNKLYESFKNVLSKRTKLSSPKDAFKPNQYITHKNTKYYTNLLNTKKNPKNLPDTGQTTWIIPNRDFSYQIKEIVADTHQAENGWQKITNKELGTRSVKKYFNEETFINNKGHKLKATEVFEWSPSGYRFVVPKNIEPGKTYYVHFKKDSTQINFTNPEHFTKLEVNKLSNGVQLNFPTKEGYRYFIETSNDLKNWKTMETKPIIGKNNEATWQFFGKEANASYYRLRVTNFNIKPEAFSLSAKTQELTLENISEKSIYQTANAWLEENNINFFAFKNEDILEIKEHINKGNDLNDVIMDIFLKSLSNSLQTKTYNLTKTILNTNTPSAELLVNKEYAIKSNTKKSEIKTKTISNIRNRMEEIPFDEYVMLRSYKMPYKQEENLAKFVNYASFSEHTKTLYKRIAFFRTIKGYELTPSATFNEFGKGISNFSSKYVRGNKNGHSPAEITYEQLPYFTLNIKDINSELVNTAFVKSTDGYYLFPANQKAGTQEYKETITEVIIPQLANIYKTNKDLNVLKTMLILEESTNTPQILDKLITKKDLNTSAKIEFNENLETSHVLTLLNTDSNTLLSIESEPAKSYLTKSLSRMFDKNLSFDQAKELFLIIQEMYTDSIPIQEKNKLGNKSFLIIHKLNEYIDKGILENINYSNDMANNIKHLPKQIGTLSSKTSVSLKDVTENNQTLKLAVIDYKVGNKTITYQVYLDQTGKMQKIITSGDILDSATGNYLGSNDKEVFLPSNTDTQYIVKRIEQALIGSEDPILQELLKVNEQGILELNNPKAIQLLNNTGNIRSTDNEVFFVCKTSNLESDNPTITIIEDAKGVEPIAIKAILEKKDNEINTDTGKIFLHKSKSLGIAEWQELSWNSIGQSNLNIGEDGLSVRVQSSWLGNLVKSILVNWVIGMAGGWLFSMAKEAVEGIELAKQAMETMEWINNAKSTANSFLAPFHDAKNIVDNLKNPQKLLEAYIPVEIKKIESELKGTILEIKQNIEPIEKNIKNLEKTKAEIENNYMPIIKVGDVIIKDAEKKLVSIVAEIDENTQSIQTKAVTDIEKIKEHYENEYGESLSDLKEIKFEFSAPISMENGTPIYSDSLELANNISLPKIMKEDSITEANILTENLTINVNITEQAMDTRIETADIKIDYLQGTPSITDKNKQITISTKLVEDGTISFEEYEEYITSHLLEIKQELENPIVPENISVVTRDTGNSLELAITDITSGTIFVTYDKDTNKIKYSPYMPSFYGNQNQLDFLIKLTKSLISPLVLSEKINNTLKSLGTLKALKKSIIHNSPRLTDDAMTKTLAHMSDWIYNPNNKPEEMQEWLKAGFKAVYDKINGHSRLICDDKDTGYYGEFLVNENNKTIVMVNRGTELMDVNDHITNIDVLFKKITGKQIISATNFYDSFRKNYPEYKGYQMIHTGHSLGGMIGQSIADKNNNYSNDIAVVFCSPGILDNEKKDRSYINNYIHMLDPVPYISFSAMKYYFVSPTNINLNPLDYHSLDYFKKPFNNTKPSPLNYNNTFLTLLKRIMI